MPGWLPTSRCYGRLAAAQGRPVRAARLYGCASVLRESVGIAPVRARLARPGAGVARLRATLGEEAFAEAWAEGRALTLDESLDYALEEEAV